MKRNVYKKNLIGSIAVIVLFALILVGCGTQEPSDAEAPAAEEPAAEEPVAEEPAAEEPAAQEEKILTICLGGETTSLNKNIGQGGGGALGITIYEGLFNNLVQPDRVTGEVSPELATEWKVLDDGITWQFKLREDVVFHNGEGLTANDVKVSLDNVIGSETAVSNVYRRLLKVDRVEVVDEYTVNIITTEPFVLLPISVGDAAIYPADYYLEVGEDGFSENPVGSGQFMFEEWTKGTSITLVKNPNYFGAQTNVDKVIFRPFPEAGARIAGLESGECDIISSVPPDDANRLSDAGFNIVWSPLGQAMLVQLVPVPGTPLEDVLVRQAMNYAVDKESLVDNVMLGYGSVMDGQLVGPDGFGYNPNLEPFPYDPDKARELLAEAGYPDGFTIDFQSSEGRYVKQREVSEAVVGMLAEVGITMNLDISEWGTFINRIIANSDDRAPTWYIGLNYYPAMDAEFIIQHYISSSGLKQFFSPTLDDLYTQQSQEFDSETRLLILQEFMQVINDEVPNIFLFQAPDVYSTNPRVQGYEATPDNYIHLDTINIEG